MKIVRIPLRISLGGGGTDLPFWYKKHGSFFMSAAIDKYIYFTGSERSFDNKIWLGYSLTEIADSISDIKHELFGATLEQFNNKYNFFSNGLEIHSISDVPGKSGLGSSGAFICGLIYLINSIKHLDLVKKDIAELACYIEMELLKKSSGKQDQFISCMGGIKSFKIDNDGNVDASNLPISREVTKRLNNNLLIYYSGIARDADLVLKDQTENIVSDAEIESGMHRIQEIGYESYDAITGNNLNLFGSLMDEHWRVKKTLSPLMTDNVINRIYDKAINYGALGGKIMGAGGGGFFLFYVPESSQESFRLKMCLENHKELDWNFDFDGCALIHSK